MPPGSSQMHEADIVYENGVPKLANQRKILDSRDLPFRATLEPQNYRPPQERELIFSAYDYQQTEVFGVDLTTGKLTNYSNGPGVTTSRKESFRPASSRRSNRTSTTRPGKVSTGPTSTS